MTFIILPDGGLLSMKYVEQFYKNHGQLRAEVSGRTWVILRDMAEGETVLEAVGRLNTILL